MTPAPVGLRCPDHSGKPQGIRKVAKVAGRTSTGFGSQYLNGATLALIAINVGVVVVELGINGSFTNNDVFLKGVLWGPFVANGDWWRLVTSMFLHANIWHIAVNMWSLYIVGTILEQAIGRWRFLLLYLVSGIAGSAGALVWSPTQPTVGASGAIFGILGALFILERRGSIQTGGQVAGMIVLNLVITFVFSSYISVGGHVGGLIGGVALMWMMLHFRRSSWAMLSSGAAIVAISVVVAYAKVRNLQ
jgi:membrane associated rhomboid family serine protease